ncbi:MAG: hypothetical protein KJ645_05965 [Planctomycetes bacterium]|nr:hypothetical protein [Planctomycetota bacterium]
MDPRDAQDPPKPEEKKSHNLTDLLPDEILGWHARKPDGLYTADTLYDLIDGGAEVYRALRVRHVLSRRYEKAGAPEIFADLFDMGSIADAFGAYRHDMHEGDDPGIGTESEMLGTSLTFWQDRYFVSLIALDETEEMEKALLNLGKAVSDRLPQKGRVPDLLNLLPDSGSIRKLAHYFHDKGLLDRHYPLGEENLLDLDGNTEGLLVRCLPENASSDGEKVPGAVLLVIRYPSEQRAREAHQRFLSQYLVGSGSDGMTRIKNRWAGAVRKDRLVIIVLDALSRSRGRAWLDRILEKSTSETERGADHEKE